MSSGRLPEPGTDLDPPDSALIKHERGTWVWRERDSSGRGRVLKLYRHRGRWTALRSRVLRFRVEREYRRLRHLDRHGLSCTEPLGWWSGVSEAHGHHELLITTELSDAIQLRHYLAGGGDRGVLGPLYRTVRAMHESGFCNQTLFASNVLVEPAAPIEDRCHLADVPRSWTFPRSIAGTPMAWYDLLDLSLSIVETGVPWDAVPVDQYGLGSAGQRWWRAHGPERPGGAVESRAKPIRQRRDAFTRVRWAWAWALHGWRAGGRREG